MAGVTVIRGTVGHMPAVPIPIPSPPEPNRRDRRTARTRQAIIDAGRTLIDEQGYAHTTIDQIAERADVAARTFFRHFASKEALLFAHFEEHRHLMVDLIRAQPPDAHPLKAALDGLAELCNIIEADRDQFMWAFQVMQENDLLYERSIIKAETSDRVGDLLAERLGVDRAADCRPHLWAMIALTILGNAVRAAYGAGGTGQARQSFEALVIETARCFDPSVGG
jgi:TetR/AcrR family transcriptional regulator, regulator of mycofactocin system